MGFLQVHHLEQDLGTGVGSMNVRSLLSLSC